MTGRMKKHDTDKESPGHPVPVWSLHQTTRPTALRVIYSSHAATYGVTPWLRNAGLGLSTTTTVFIATTSQQLAFTQLF